MAMSSAPALLPPKQQAGIQILANLENSMGSWSALDETGPDSVGVGIFFKSGQEGSLLVSSIVPGSSAHLSGLIMVGDRIAGVDNEVIVGKSQKALREKVHGKPGTFVALDIERKLDDGDIKVFRVNCMRGSPAFIKYQDKYGVSNASRLDELVLQKREEQKFNSLVEKQLRIEQTKFASAQRQRREIEEKERGLRQELERLQNELYLSEQKLSSEEEESKILQFQVMHEREEGALIQPKEALSSFNIFTDSNHTAGEVRFRGEIDDAGEVDADEGRDDDGGPLGAPLKVLDRVIFRPLSGLFGANKSSSS